jgi:hypothetical protein
MEMFWSMSLAIKQIVLSDGAKAFTMRFLACDKIQMEAGFSGCWSKVTSPHDGLP